MAWQHVHTLLWILLFIAVTLRIIPVVSSEIDVGNAGCNGSAPCVSSAVCESQICKIPAGGGCSNNQNHCITNAVCDINICKIQVGNVGCNETSPCVSSAICENGNCKIPVGGSGCSNQDHCVTNATCEKYICKIEAGKAGCYNSAQCVSIAACENHICKITAGSGSCNNDDECVTNAICQNHNCRWIYGSTCQHDNECRTDVHEDCSTLRCLCSSDFFRDNNQCMSVSNLAVLNVRNIGLQETAISVAWDRTNIHAEYMATIKSSIGSEKQTPWSNNSFANFTDLTEGTRYDVTVTIKRTKDPGFGNNFVTFSMAPVAMHTKPAKPGQLTEEKYSVGNIVLKFVASAGHTDNYIVTVLTITLSVRSPEANFTGILAAGRSYDVTIVAVSNGLTSDPMTDTFAVSAELAGEVYDLDASNRSSRWIWVTYQRPKKPNGDIMGYTVTALIEDRCVSAVIINCSDCGSNSTNTPTADNCPNTTTNTMNQYDLNKDSMNFTVNVTSLQPDVTYKIYVTAFNQFGKGISAISTSKTEIERAKNLLSLSISKLGVEQLHVTWVSGERTGPTNYSITLEEETGLDSGEYVFNGTFRSEGYDMLKSYNISNLLSYWNYRITVQPYTVMGPSPSNRTEIHRTQESEPGLVESLQADPSEETATKATLQFRCPPERQRNGKITSYNYTSIVISSKMNNPTKPNGELRDPDGNKCEFSVSIDVTAETSYTISVFAVTDSGLEGERLSHTLIIGSKPPKLSTPPDTKLVSEVGATTDSVTVKLCRCAVSRDEGIITLAGLIVCVKSSSEKCEAGTETSNTIYYDRLPTWNQFRNNNFTGRYKPTPADWHTQLEEGEDGSRQRRAVSDASKDMEKNFYQYIVGDDRTCDQQNASVFCNGPLPEDTNFIIIVWVCTSAGCTESPNILEVRTKAEEKSESQVGAIVGGILGALAVIVLIIVAVFMFRRSNSGRKKQESDFLNSIRSRIIRKPVKLKDFATHLDRLHLDLNLRFLEEFEDIQKSVPANCFTQEAALLDANKIKSRHINILPFDQTRVKLSAGDDDEIADFINASYIPGFSSPKEYIATQCPMIGTIKDFWRMIWEQNSLQIVMLSDTQEKWRPQLDQYWPDKLNSAIQYGDIIVKMTSHSLQENYIIRTFHIHKENRPSNKRRVQQYFIPGWEEFTANVIDFIRTVRRDAQPFIHGPITVHCSVGVGRTGTFIALDFLMQFVDKNDLDAEVDIYSLVLNMRRNRPYMVQTERQYIFIHDALKLIIEKKIERMRGQSDPFYNNSVEDNIYAEIEEENMYEKPTTML